MSQCNYVRKSGKGYEFGYMQVTGVNTKNEKREHIPLGNRPSLDEALAANNMALKGLPRKGHFVKPLLYGGSHDFTTYLEHLNS